MRLREQLLDEPPVVFDISQLPEESHKHGDSLPSLFAFGHASFGDDLLDAVALCDGIDQQGRLDADMLAAARVSTDYLSDKQGQPLLLVETVTNPEARPTKEGFNYVVGYIAVVANVEMPVGMNGDSISLRRRAGIAVAPGYTDLNGYFDTSGNYRSQYLSDVKGERIGFSSRNLILGKPGAAINAERIMPERDYQQHLVAGADVVPWIREMFQSDNAFRFYCDVIFALLRHNHALESLDSIIDEKFVQQVREEVNRLNTTEAIITKYEKESELLRKIQEGRQAEATLQLMAIEEAYGDRTDMIPRTSGSYPLSVTASLEQVGDSLAARIRAIDYHKNHLAQLSLRAAQIGL